MVATSVAPERAQEVASAAVSETVSAMFDSATTMAVAAVERPVQQVLAPATASTSSGHETAVVPPLLSDAPELSKDRAISIIELSGRDREDEESFGGEEGTALKPPAEALLSPPPQHVRNESDTPVKAPNRSRTSRGDDDDALVIPDVDRPINDEVNKCDDAEGAHPEKYERKGMRDKQGGGARQEDTQERVGNGKAQDDSTERQGGRENKVDFGEEVGSSKDGDGQMLHHSGPEDGPTVLVSGVRKGAVVQVVERLHPSYQLIVSVRLAASALSWVERNGTLDESKSSHRQRGRTATSEEGGNPVNEYGKATVAASLSLGKSEIMGAIERPATAALPKKTPPPHYSEAMKFYAATQRSSPTPKTGPAQHHHQRTPSSREAATRHVPSGSVISSGDASSFSSDGDASLGPPPSYHSTASGGGTARSSSASAEGMEDEKDRLARDLPPPSYGSPDAQPEKQLGTHRRPSSSDGGGGGSGSSRLWASGGGTIERLGTDDGDRGSVRGGAGASRGRRPPHEGRGGWTRSPTASGGTRPMTTMAVSRGKSRHGTKDATTGLPLREGRRRAEAAANAAERRAWKTADVSTTNRVLDLMLVTERVRQEEQKRRVAEASANNQVQWGGRGREGCARAK
ncbi:unnamed protein product [Ectocarpus sp. CCAP 1310/34]|nr:unnamed protein product [Ectocarpus sp. CCAP 1310/34]